MHPITPIQCIIPPHLLRNIAEKGHVGQSDKAMMTLVSTEQLRGRRTGLTHLSSMFPTVVTGEGKNRVVYTASTTQNLPGQPLRSEGDPPHHDPAVNEAFDGCGCTYDLFHEVFGRNSVDGRGLQLESTVHYQDSYDNAFWDGQQMVYGDGDEDLPENDRIFNRFTMSLDVIGHELTHGVIQNGSRLVYWGQSGALNESFADIFGIMVRQYRDRQTAEQSDWLIGREIFSKNIRAKALRSMRDPGSAYNDPVIGQDPQPGHFSQYVDTSADNSGVHINSGIPNKAFCVSAIEMGGYPWEKAGQIWYEAIAGKLSESANFQEAADLTYSIAGEKFGKGSKEQMAVKKGWLSVGIHVESKQIPGTPTPSQGNGCLPALFGILSGNKIAKG